ncbi:ANTAR domain-containing protein [Streptomyces sp. NPDC051636]|uniref:ANTAR domain-containing protein n=1 Tax=Streptomyces sp. NPDC051636 TaxID=3365663 RepID=UPI00378D18FD
MALRAEMDQPRRAPAARAVVEQACGTVMVLAPCRRGPARSLPADMSRQCNTELPDVAAALVATWEGEPLSRLTQRGRGVRCGGSPRKTEGAADHRRLSRPEGDREDAADRVSCAS